MCFLGKQSLHLKELFRQADKNNSGTLNLKECTELITNFLHIKTKKDLNQLFNEADFDKTGRNGDNLTEIEFSYFYYSLLKNQKLVNIFETYSKNNENKMTSDDLMRFFSEKENKKLTLKDCSQLIEKFEPSLNSELLSMEGFTHLMLFSDLISVLDQSKLKGVYQDMTQPLSHYWIASSHNT